MRAACLLISLTRILFAQDAPIPLPTPHSPLPISHSLTNQDVVTLAQAGFDEPFILKQIRTSHTHFDTTVDGLVSLKKAGLNEDVIQAMVDVDQKKILGDNPAALPAGAAKPKAKTKSSGHWWQHSKSS